MTGLTFQKELILIKPTNYPNVFYNLKVSIPTKNTRWLSIYKYSIDTNQVDREKLVICKKFPCGEKAFKHLTGLRYDKKSYYV